MDDHMIIRGNAFATRQNYLRGVKVLMEYYDKVPEACTVEEIKSYLSLQKSNGSLSSSTLNVRVSCLKYYFRHIVNRLDLVVRIPNPRVSKYETEILHDVEIKRLFASCRDLRQLLLLQLLYDCGLRVSELSRLRTSDFNKSNMTIHIRKSKGCRTRTVYYGKRLRDTLNNYAKTVNLTTDVLLESYKEKGKGLSISGIQHLVKEIVRRSGIKKKASCHTFRHSYAVHYLNRGGSIFMLQKLLGHRHLSTTLEYLKHARVPDGIRMSTLDHLLGVCVD